MLISYREAQRQDADSISDLIRSIGWFSHLDQEGEETTINRVRKHIDLCLTDQSHTIYVAVIDQIKLVGYISVHWLPYLFLKGEEGYISELFVHEKYRGRRIGSNLFELVKADAEKRGCSRLSLLNSRTRESYKQSYYKNLGWQERPQVANFIFKL
jgi:N-acetylglutamate synthase-like GNAT family acetyltransferase